MGKKEAPADAELDEDGLVVHTYVSRVLVVLPAGGFDETTMRYARSSLYNVHVRTELFASDDSGILEGAMQDMLQADGKLAEARMDDYSGVIFVGGPAAIEMAEQPEVQRLAREALAADKLVCAWGDSVLVLARAGALKGRRVTGARTHKAALEAAGARFKGTQVEIDKNLVTAADSAAGFRMGKALATCVGIG